MRFITVNRVPDGPWRLPNAIIGIIFAILVPVLLGFTNGKDPSGYWSLSFLFVTAVVAFIWFLFSLFDTYHREGLPWFHPVPNWPWCFCFWLLSFSLMCLDLSRARLEKDFHNHLWSNPLKFSLMVWGVIALIQYLRLRIQPD